MKHCGVRRQSRSISRGYPAVAVFAIGLALISLSCCHIVNRTDLTRTAMLDVCELVHQYAKEHGAMPLSLADLPKPEGDFDYLIDGWGRPLLYKIEGGATLRICSYGKDGLRGGEGENADVCFAYYLRRSDGSFWASADGWVVAARVLEDNGRVVR